MMGTQFKPQVTNEKGRIVSVLMKKRQSASPGHITRTSWSWDLLELRFSVPRCQGMPGPVESLAQVRRPRAYGLGGGEGGPEQGVGGCDAY